MEKVLVTFANNETITLHCGQIVNPLKTHMCNDGTIVASQAAQFVIEYHHHAGLIPSVTELICSCELFSTEDNPGKLYKTSSVVSVEKI